MLLDHYHIWLSDKQEEFDDNQNDGFGRAII